MKGGARKGAGRPPIPAPTTPAELAAQLGVYVGSLPTTAEGVVVDLEAGARLLRMLRRKKAT